MSSICTDRGTMAVFWPTKYGEETIMATTPL